MNNSEAELTEFIFEKLYEFRANTHDRKSNY